MVHGADMLCETVFEECLRAPQRYIAGSVLSAAKLCAAKTAKLTGTLKIARIVFCLHRAKEGEEIVGVTQNDLRAASSRLRE